MSRRLSHSSGKSAGVLESVERAWPVTEWKDVHVLVAVSGGPDSMALLRALDARRAGARGAGRVLAGHVNHGLRPSADADRRWLRSECQRLRIELLERGGDAAALAVTQGDGVEAAARKLRYGLLTDMAESVGARYVVVGHTVEDQVETVLFRLAR
ncbi:MAG: tRNA lysidine(34) synthetase TilS, partial [Planctomycetota bacterium]